MNDQSQPSQPSWGNNGQPGQSLLASGQTGQPQGGTPPTSFGGSGLLSKWKASQGQQSYPGSGNGTPAVTPPPFANRTISQQLAPQEPTTPPAFQANGGMAQPYQPAPYAGQAAPIGAQSLAVPFSQPQPAGLGMTPFAMQPGTMSYAQYSQAGHGYGPQMMPGSALFAPGNPLAGQMPPQGGTNLPPGNWQTMGPNGLPPYRGGPPTANGGRPNGHKNGPKQKRRFPIWARIVVGILVVLLLGTSAGAYYYYSNFSKPLSDITGQQVTRVQGDDNPNAGRSSNNNGILSGGRFNILLLGSDDDYKSVVINGGILAQTDIVVSVDPASKTVSMLSIPRDSWVNIPGHGMGKLDQAYLLGGGGANGAALSMATIHEDFGIYIDHYAWVGLSGFVNVINTVGGIDINVLHPITDDAYPDDTGKGATEPYATKRLYIAPGPQHLDGLAALEYVRSRHADLVGDFGRSVRQQQILSQLKYKLDNPNVIGELPQLAHDLDGQVKTDMQLQDVFNLMYFAKSLQQGQIHQYTLGPGFSSTTNINTASGQQSVVVLDCAKVVPLIAQIFAIGNQATCQQVNTNSPMATAASPQAPSQADVPAQQAAPAASNGSVSWPALPISAMSIANGNYDFLGIHSLLDLLFMVVFESPDVLQI